MIRNILKKKFTFLNLTKDETVFYKGLAILMILMHNFFHLLPPFIGENEQDFNQERVESLINIVVNHPEYMFQAIISFLGHYGVQVFIFLSAYGLTKKYFNKNIIYFEFLKRRIIKIYPAFLFSILIWALYKNPSHGGPINVIIDNWDQLLNKLLLISNFIPGQLYSLNGPWWFVSLIVQFYLLFPSILTFYKKYREYGLIILSIVSILVTYFLIPIVSFPLTGTIIAHIPEISIGVILASKNKFSLSYLMILLILIVFLFSNYFYFMWLLSYSSILILLLILFQNILGYTNNKMKYVITFVGSISMYIFYINGFMRQPWLNIAKEYDNVFINILICILFIAIVSLGAFAMTFLANKIVQIRENKF
jgi:peptidoglycan/LPS O-acetylase OafA/YrhL